MRKKTRDARDPSLAQDDTKRRAGPRVILANFCQHTSFGASCTISHYVEVLSIYKRDRMSNLHA